MREKYGLPEVGPEDEPIEEIFLDDEPVSPQEFRHEIGALVKEIPAHVPSQTPHLSMAKSQCLFAL
jgi:hypothetical protein